MFPLFRSGPARRLYPLPFLAAALFLYLLSPGTGPSSAQAPGPQDPAAATAPAPPSPPGDASAEASAATNAPGSPSADPAEPPSTSPGGPILVTASAYVNRITNLQLAEFGYDLDFYLWLSWKGPEDFDPTSLDFMNGLEINSELQEKYQLADGSQYRCFRIRGRFLGSFDFRHYPFDQHRIGVQLEDQQNDGQQLVYVAGPVTLDPHGGLPSWQAGSASSRVTRHVYETNFGDPVRHGASTVYSRFEFDLPIERLITPYLIKFILPLIIVANCAFLVFFLEKQLEVELNMVMTALLMAIAFHISQADQLPDVGYMTMADAFFFLCYVVIFATVCETVVWHRLEERHPEGTLHLRIEKVARWLIPAVFYGSLLMFISYGLLTRA